MSTVAATRAASAKRHAESVAREAPLVAAILARRPRKQIAHDLGVSVSLVSRVAVRYGLATRRDVGQRRR